ncbi:hypothetical protein J5N97_018730 [Dioscorea zingiberensis]|uniref:Uncharacterized protein n=1 Tax=Dioscorea zingiberensis TaxID=325984 RepID=A0A9D5HBQ9_9LILI|nr:hypothetical protein J5N97_018730 [Dioscorea zingiberensis]
MASISSFSSRIRQPPPPSKVSAFQFQHPARTSSRAAVTSSKPGDDEARTRTAYLFPLLDPVGIPNSRSSLVRDWNQINVAHAHMPSKMDIELDANKKSSMGFPIQKFFSDSKDEIFLVLEKGMQALKDHVIILSRFYVCLMNKLAKGGLCICLMNGWLSNSWVRWKMLSPKNVVLKLLDQVEDVVPKNVLIVLD